MPTTSLSQGETPSQHDDTLLTEKQVAEWLQLSVRSIQAWRGRGGGPAFSKCGRCVRYRASEISRWLDERQRSSTSDPGSSASGG
jgi:predicted DNA-binding transcriptional regulator AlpA